MLLHDYKMLQIILFHPESLEHRSPGSWDRASSLKALILGRAKEANYLANWNKSVMLLYVYIYNYIILYIYIQNTVRINICDVIDVCSALLAAHTQTRVSQASIWLLQSLLLPGNSHKVITYYDHPHELVPVPRVVLDGETEFWRK